MFLVCGEALYDIFIDGEDAGSLLLNARAGGSPFNVALGLSRLNESVGLLTGLSNDAMGERLLQMLLSEGVSKEYLIHTDRPTTLVMVNVCEDGQPGYTFYGKGSADCGLGIKDLPNIRKSITGIHFGSYSLVVTPVADAFAHLRDENPDLFISVDPNVRLSIEPNVELWQQRIWQYIATADLVKISAEDIRALYPYRRLEDFAQEVLGYDVQLLVITDGSNEVSGWTANGLMASIKPAVGTVVDTVGAGDTFQCAILQQLLKDGNPKKRVRDLTKQELDQMIIFACRAAAITCSRRGADLPTLSEIT